MSHIIVQLYQLVGVAFNFIIPLAMLLGILLLLIKMGKGFIRSIMK